MKSIIAHILMTAALFSQPVNLHAEEIVINAVGDVMLAGRWAST